MVSAFIATALAQDDAEAARLQWRKVADQLRPSIPKLARLMNEAEPDARVSSLDRWGGALLAKHNLPSFLADLVNARTLVVAKITLTRSRKF